MKVKFAFEVKESDLLGRVGTLKVGGKAIETPYMFPVIHPVSQIVPTAELLSMGFGGLMTNSYIIHSRRRQEALDLGIHRLLGFDGVFMTDSGGYQVLEYGDLEVGYGDVARFQADMGAELAVTLDRPTGYPQRRRVAKETVDYSLANARATLDEYGGRDTVWVGPIQGGLYQDLVKRSAKSLVAAGFEFLALGSPVQVMQNYMYADLVDMIMAARRSIPYSTPLHLFGAGHPLTMPLAVALGCDTFDSASYVIFARSGRYMTRSGILALRSMKYLPCSCPVCSRTSVKELLEMGHEERTKALSAHNLFVLKEELDGCKEAVVEGRLWDLVEERSMAHPRLKDAFRRLAGHADDLAVGTPTMKDRGLFVRSDLDLQRPELKAARARLRSVARTGRGRQTHPILGPYPSALEFDYPLSQTEVADTVGPMAPKRKGKRARSRRNRRGASPSPRSSSARPR